VNVGRFGARAGGQPAGVRRVVARETAGSLPASLRALRPDSNLSAGDFEDLDGSCTSRARATAQLGGGGGAARSTPTSGSTTPSASTSTRSTTPTCARSRATARSARTWTGRVARRALGGDAGAARRRERLDQRRQHPHLRRAHRPGQTTDVESPIRSSARTRSATTAYGPVTLSAAGATTVVRVPFRNRLQPRARHHEQLPPPQPQGRRVASRWRAAPRCTRRPGRASARRR
jgi:hypothetical protein